MKKFFGILFTVFMMVFFALICICGVALACESEWYFKLVGAIGAAELFWFVYLMIDELAYLTYPDEYQGLDEED